MTQASIAVSQTPPLPGLSLVQTTNAALQTVATDFSGDTDPAAFAGPFMKWADTANGLLKRRNAAGTAWITEGTLFQQSVDTFPDDSIPSTDQGPINVSGQGLMEWDGTDYNKYISVQPAHGQCRLVYTSGTQCTLMPFKGNHLVVGGRTYRIDNSGIVLPNTGLAASTLYYLYAYIDAGAVKVEASTTGYVKGPGGVEVRNGDSSRTLVGKVVTTSGSMFTDTDAARGVASWFNPRQISANALVQGSSFTSTSDALVAGATITFLPWQGDSFACSFDGYGTSNTGVSGTVLTLYLNGNSSGRIAAYTVPGANYSCGFSQSLNFKANAESMVTMQIYGRVAPSGVQSTVNNMSLNALEMA
ncbi:hypothetical protein [Bordetella genomosp. 11]|uniref:Uncharacterized protein n=1 Tax=Bordetella genomosp. 11 TaxID=1416808 RepID=A0A261UHZ2_9BORD|nr:hypothetical protein [Bordetella genomosp. 11]OZI61546.1 hypothetical protein CAL28_19885 [Bordetella genomosp. 11]